MHCLEIRCPDVWQKRTAEKHLEEVYGDTDFKIERVGFNFKNIDYYVHITSPSSEALKLKPDMPSCLGLCRRVQRTNS